jgi:hypothetical protein
VATRHLADPAEKLGWYSSNSHVEQIVVVGDRNRRSCESLSLEGLEVVSDRELRETRYE